MAFIAVGTFTPVYSISLFLPTIIKELGYADNAAQLMTVPPYALACLCTIAGSYFADRAGQRGIFLLGFELLAIVGFIMLISNGLPHVQYVGTFFAAAGENLQPNILNLTLKLPQVSTQLSRLLAHGIATTSVVVSSVASVSRCKLALATLAVSLRLSCICPRMSQGRLSFPTAYYRRL
jgi:MFS family permease